jgi:hypothetical protein
MLSVQSAWEAPESTVYETRNVSLSRSELEWSLIAKRVGSGKQVDVF